MARGGLYCPCPCQPVTDPHTYLWPANMHVPGAKEDVIHLLHISMEAASKDSVREAKDRIST